MYSLPALSEVSADSDYRFYRIYRIYRAYRTYRAYRCDDSCHLHDVSATFPSASRPESRCLVIHICRICSFFMKEKLVKNIEKNLIKLMLKINVIV